MDKGNMHRPLSCCVPLFADELGELNKLRLVSKSTRAAVIFSLLHQKVAEQRWKWTRKKRLWSFEQLQREVTEGLVAAGLASKCNQQNTAEAKRLNRGLTLGVKKGELVDFSEEGGRAVYVHSKMYSRSRILSGVLLLDHPVMRWVRNELFVTRTECRVASIGGGPGFDLLSLAFLKKYSAYGMSHVPNESVFTVSRSFM